MSVLCFYAASAQAISYDETPFNDDVPIDDVPDTDTDTDTSTPIDKDKIKKKVRANFFLNFDFGEEILNLTPHPTNAIFEAARDTLIYGDYAGGFRVTKYADISAGLGGRISWYYPNRTGLSGKHWAYVGLTPYAGRTTLSHQFQPTLQKAFNAKARKVPMKATDFGAWAINDSVNFASSGGLIFSVGVGAPGINIGTDYIIEGTFATYVEKVSPTEVYVMLSNIEAKNLSMQVNATLAAIGVSKYKEIEQGMGYMINYADPVGVMAYNDLIRGNVAAIQRLVDDPTVTAIKKWEKMTRNQVRLMKHFTFGIPFIMNWGWTSGKIYEFTDTRAYYNDTRATVDYGIFVKEKRRKIIKSMTVKTESFYGSVYKLFNNEKDLLTRYIFGQYIYNADDNKTKSKDMRKTIANLTAKTGLSEQLAVNIPGYDKLKFSRINLEVNFDEERTLRFMNIAAQLNANILEEMANQNLQKMFRYESSFLALCAQEEIEQPLTTSDCIAKLSAENKQASKSLIKAASMMKKHFEAGHDKEFSIAYANFGKAMLQNATMFQTILGIAGPGVEIVYSVQNTYFSSYRAVYLTTENPGVYKRMTKETPAMWVFENKNLNNIFKIASTQ